MSWRAFGEAFVTLVVIMDPLGSAPIFITLTAGRPVAARRRAALEAAAVAGGLVVVFALFGRLILDYLHVSVESLTIAGGMLLLLVALQMLRGEEMAQPETANVALVPLATPLLAGPGAIAAVMVLTRRYEDAPGRIGVIVAIVAIVAVVVVVAVGLLLADQIARLLRPSVIQLLTRVLGLLLSAIAVQFIIDAVKIIAVR
ncbi:MAG: MarC family protein [Chloroflexi bacterium]|nr:MAG: MarC family protein [Chloroflexota bacterium]